MRTFTALFAAAVLAVTALAPATADARGRGHGWGHYDRHYYDRDDHGDAVAAGAVGLVLGLALGSMANQRREPDCYDRCAPAQGYYEPPQGYYDNRRSAYEEDYGYAPAEPYYAPPRARCMRGERVWDRYAGHYVIVDVPC